MPAIQSDAALLNEYPEGLEGDNDILNAFLTDPEEDDDAAPQPSDKGKKQEDQETNEDEANDDDESSEKSPEDEEDEGDESEGTEDDEGDDADAEGSKKKFADDDDTYVKIKEGDKEHEVKVSDLKRLWGQEASLTRKSQEVAELKRVADEGQAKNIAAYDILLKKATERADSYRNLPWTQLMKDPNVPADQLAVLQGEAQKALEEESFLKNEITGFMQKVADEQLKVRQTSARDCIIALTNPESKHHIKGWTPAMYNDIRSFATNEMGLHADMVNGLTDPGAFKVLHMALQFSRGKSKVITKKVNKTPTKIVKNSASAPAARSSSKVVTANQAVKRAAQSGSMADAVNAFEAIFGDD